MIFEFFWGSPEIWLTKIVPILFKLGMFVPYNIPQVGPFSEFWISKNKSPSPLTLNFLGFPEIWQT